MKSRVEEAEAAINGAGFSPNYRNVFAVKILSEQAVKGYPKPQRKASTSTIMRGKIKNKEYTQATNPLIEAIDIPMINGHSVFRPPVRLPPVYESQMRELQDILHGMEGYNQMLRTDQLELNKDRCKNEFQLKFNNKVIKQRCEWPFGMDLIGNGKRLDKEMMKESSDNQKHELATFIHKSSWKTDVIKKDFVPRRKVVMDLASTTASSSTLSQDSENNPATYHDVQEILQTATEIGGKSADTFLTRNVFYMLEIWQNNEGVDLDKVLAEHANSAAQQKKLKCKNAKNAIDRLAGSRSESRPQSGDVIRQKAVTTISSGFLQPASPIDAQLVNSLGKVKVTSTEESLTGGTQSKKTLSRATVRQLRKIIKENNAENNNSLVDTMLRKTLTGTDEGVPETIAYIPLFGSVDTDAVLMKARRPTRARLHGKNGEEERLTEHEEVDAKETFNLVLPPHDTDEFIQEDEEVAIIVKAKDEDLLAQSRRPNSSRIESAPFKVVAMPVRPISTKQQEAAPQFSLISLVTELRKISKLANRKYSNAIESSGAVYQAAEIHSVTDFLSCAHKDLTKAPPQDSTAFTAILRTISLCLRESDNKVLRFEAVKVLYFMNGQKNLTRFDTLVFYATLEQMVEDGTDEQMLFAATVLVTSKLVEMKSITTIINCGLGHLSLNKNENTKNIIIDLDKRFYPMSFDALFLGCQNSNWRLRIDCLDVIHRCIRNLAKQEDKLKPIMFSAISGIYQNAVSRAIQVFLELMWYDWSGDVRKEATNILAQLGVGKPVFDWIVKLLSHQDPSKRIEALKCLGQLKIFTSTSMAAFLKILDDPFVSVRIQASKIACILATNHRLFINKLLELVDDSEWRVRAYSIKGISGSRSPKLKETLTWILAHEPHPQVKAEAIRASKYVISGHEEFDQDVKDYLLILLHDTSDLVRKEAERALQFIGVDVKRSTILQHSDETLLTSPRDSVNSNILTSSLVHTPMPSTTPRSIVSTPSIPSKRRRYTMQLSMDDTTLQTTPKSHTPAAPIVEKYDYSMTPITLYAGHSPDEIDIINAKELVTEKALESVLQQVKALSNRDNIMSQVSVCESATRSHFRQEREDERERRERDRINKFIRTRELGIRTGLEEKAGKKRSLLKSSGVGP